jgi:FMN-dependent NADH-azoreductase
MRFYLMPDPVRLLHIEASPRGARSRSSAVARRLIDRLGGVALERLNVFDVALPVLDGVTIEGRYALIAGEAVGPHAAANWAAIRAHVDHLLSFDIWVISVPMWNFGIPYPLKQYIDLVTQPGMTFEVHASGVDGLAAGRSVVLIASGALDTRPGTPLADHDHQIAYLQRWLSFIGVGDVHVVSVCPTFGPAEAVEAEMALSHSAAEKVAAVLSGTWGV